MAKWGSVDFRKLKELEKKLEKLAPTDNQRFMEECAKELAARLLGKVIRRTPVGDYPQGSGKVGGTLRRGWTAKSEAEAQSGSGRGTAAKAYADSLEVTKSGEVYEIRVINPVNYASYVEFGHRTVGGKDWVDGRFMLTISEEELERQSPRILERKLLKYLGEVFNL